MRLSCLFRDSSMKSCNPLLHRLKQTITRPSFVFLPFCHEWNSLYLLAFGLLISFCLGVDYIRDYYLSIFPDSLVRLGSMMGLFLSADGAIHFCEPVDIACARNIFVFSVVG